MAQTPFGQIAARFFKEHFRPPTPCLPADYPKCPELAGTRLGELLKSFRPDSPLVDGHNRLLGPDRLEAEGGVVVFAEENQNVSYWGVAVADLAAAVTPVLRSENVAPVTWQREFDSLDAFLSVFCLWQALNGAWPRHGLATRKAAMSKKLQSHLEPIDVGANGSGLSFFARGTDLIVATAGKELFAAANGDAAWNAFLAVAPAMRELHDE